jgi:hypothetical protein
MVAPSGRPIGHQGVGYQFIDTLVDRVITVKDKVSDTVSGTASGKRESTSSDLFE